MAQSTSAKSSDTDSFKETFESIIIAFILAFVFRAYVVEAFVIPTGSMAPTLLGAHLDLSCSQCGYRQNIDSRAANSRWANNGLTLICSMCNYPNHADPKVTRKPGDRILVHKFIYNISEPKRWDVVVFKNPQQPYDNYIKRLVGLPSERLLIVDGNVYVQPLDDPDGPWRVVRKSDRLEVQQAVWQPVYHSRYYPLDQGKPSERRGMEYAWSFPWKADSADQWERVDRLRLRHDSASEAALTFDFQTLIQGQINQIGNMIGWYPYSQFSGTPSQEPIEEIRLAVRVIPDTRGLAVTMQTTARIDGDYPVRVEASIDGQGNVLIITDGQVRATEQIMPLAGGRASEIEFWLVDQALILWLDGQVICQWAFEVPLEQLISRPPPRPLPVVKIMVSGSPVTLASIDLDRDLFYSSTNIMRQQGRGALIKDGRMRKGGPVALEADQFFCLGDNSPHSSDGRYWTGVNPWIHKRLLEGKQQYLGVVPRELMIGKAFFVYFPSPYSLSPTGANIVPNFGDIRFIH